ncbi:MAG: chemotaxis protein histidine kinase CheA, partial [bacterium]
ASIHKIYENPDLYMALINLIEEAITQLDTVEVSLKNQTISSDQVIEAKRLLHSIKGNSGLFKLDDLRDVSHSLEESLDAQLINRPEETEYYIQTFYERKPLLTKQLHYVNCLMDNIGEELRKRLLGVVFTTEEYQTLKDTVFEKSNQEIQQFIIDMEKVPVWNLVRGWKEEAEQLSGVLGKKVRFRIEGENIRIPNVLFRCLHTPLIHLLRNAVDHGLETPLGRKATGKNEVGLIRIKSSKTEDGQLEIAISDDGYGLDLSRIVEKARKNKKIDQNFVDESIANQEAWRIIFLPDFSTADEVTEVSGRGVGLSAIQKTIDELNGKIHVTSALSKGTTLSLRIPLDGVNFSQISKNDLN